MDNIATGFEQSFQRLHDVARLIWSDVEKGSASGIQ